MRRDDFLIVWRRFFAVCARAKKEIFIALVLAALFFLWGAQSRDDDGQRLAQRLEVLQEESRLAAKQKVRAANELSRLRAKNALDEKIIGGLNRRIERLIAADNEREARLVLYRQLLESSAKKEEVIIYALGEDADFLPNQRKLRATLVRRGKGRRFRGGYFFEVIQSQNGKRQVVRVPPKKAKLDFELYREIEETFALPATAKIDNLRVVIVDRKDAVVAEQQLIEDADDDAESIDDAPDETRESANGDGDG